MREAHREAARILYEERNQDTGPKARELYVDLHGKLTDGVAGSHNGLQCSQAYIQMKQCHIWKAFL